MNGYHIKSIEGKNKTNQNWLVVYIFLSIYSEIWRAKNNTRLSSEKTFKEDVKKIPHCPNKRSLKFTKNKQNISHTVYFTIFYFVLQ